MLLPKLKVELYEYVLTDGLSGIASLEELSELWDQGHRILTAKQLSAEAAFEYLQMLELNPILQIPASIAVAA